jgi:hypothetical protein
MAERVGFEPTVPVKARRISSAVLSTTQPPLRAGCEAFVEGPPSERRNLVNGPRRCKRRIGAEPNPKGVFADFNPNVTCANAHQRRGLGRLPLALCRSGD